MFFLKAMVKQKDNLDGTMKQEHALRVSLPALSRNILELARARGEITSREIEEAMGANCNTIKAHVKNLAGRQYLHLIGNGRGARYRAAWGRLCPYQ